MTEGELPAATQGDGARDILDASKLLGDDDDERTLLLRLLLRMEDRPQVIYTIGLSSFTTPLRPD